MEANGFLARLNEHDRRLGEIDRARSRQWDRINEQGREQTAFKKDVENIRDDIKEMKDDFGEQMKWIRRGMWVAAGTFLTFILMLAGVLAAVLA